MVRVIELANEGFQFVSFFGGIETTCCHLPRPPTFLGGGVHKVSEYGFTIPYMSCALQLTLTLIVCEVRGSCPKLAVLRYEVDAIWCG